MTQKYAVQNFNTGEMFVQMFGSFGVEWSRDRGMIAQLSKGQADKVRDALIRENHSGVRPVVVKVYP